MALYLSASNRSRVDDLMQEGWIAIWRAVPNHNPDKGPLDKWLCDKAQWAMLAKIREWQGNKHTFYDSFGDMTAFTEVELVEATEALERVEIAYHRGEILQAISSLTPKQREYIIMKFWFGLTFTEIVEQIGYNPASVHRLSMNKLRKELAHLGAES